MIPYLYLLQGLYVTGTVLACEMFPVSLRSTMAPMTTIFGTVATMAISLWAFLLNRWRSLQLWISLAGILFLFYYRLVHRFTAEHRLNASQQTFRPFLMLFYQSNFHLPGFRCPLQHDYSITFCFQYNPGIFMLTIFTIFNYSFYERN